MRMEARIDRDRILILAGAMIDRNSQLVPRDTHRDRHRRSSCVTRTRRKHRPEHRATIHHLHPARPTAFLHEARTRRQPHAKQRLLRTFHRAQHTQQIKTKHRRLNHSIRVGLRIRVHHHRAIDTASEPPNAAPCPSTGVNDTPTPGTDTPSPSFLAHARQPQAFLVQTPHLRHSTQDRQAPADPTTSRPQSAPKIRPPHVYPPEDRSGPHYQSDSPVTLSPTGNRGEPPACSSTTTGKPQKPDSPPVPYPDPQTSSWILLAEPPLPDYYAGLLRHSAPAVLHPTTALQEPRARSRVAPKAHRAVVDNKASARAPVAKPMHTTTQHAIKATNDRAAITPTPLITNPLALSLLELL